MRTLSESEIQCVSGCGVLDDPIEKNKIDAGGAIGLAAGIGFASFGGAGWGAMGVAAAFATAPVAVIAIGALAGYAGFRYFYGR